MKRVTVSAPASVANLGCGFDVLGFALRAPRDTVTVEECPGPSELSVQNANLPADFEHNTCGFAIARVQAMAGDDRPVRVTLHKGIALGSGIGSSAASAVAGAVAIHHFLGSPLSEQQILNAAAEAEVLASGVAHADNVAPSLLGGCTVVTGEPGNFEAQTLAAPPGLFYAVVHPHLSVDTASARAVLPKDVPLSRAVTQWGHVAGLVAAIAQGDLPAIGHHMQDAIIEPARKPLIPHFDGAREAARSAGALGFAISGAGPSVVGLAEGQGTAQKLADAVAAHWSAQGVASDRYVDAVATQGATLEASPEVNA